MGEDPRIKDFEGGGKVAQFSLATTEKGFTTSEGKQIPEETTWHNIVVKRMGLAGVCQQFIKKGTPLLVKGKIQSRQYTDTQGVTRYITEIVVDDLTLLGKKERESAPAPEPEYRQRPANPGGNATQTFPQPNYPPQYRPQYQQPPVQNYPGYQPGFNSGDMPDFER